VLDVRKYVCEYHLKLCRCTMPPKKVQIQRTGISSCCFFNSKTAVKNAPCDNDTSDIDIVNEETHNCMVFEEHTSTLFVNDCDYYSITDDEETDGSYIGENTLDSRSAVKMETYR